MGVAMMFLALYCLLILAFAIGGLEEASGDSAEAAGRGFFAGLLVYLGFGPLCAVLVGVLVLWLWLPCKVGA